MKLDQLLAAEVQVFDLSEWVGIVKGSFAESMETLSGEWAADGAAILKFKYTASKDQMMERIQVVRVWIDGKGLLHSSLCRDTPITPPIPVPAGSSFEVDEIIEPHEWAS